MRERRRIRKPNLDHYITMREAREINRRAKEILKDGGLKKRSTQEGR